MEENSGHSGPSYLLTIILFALMFTEALILKAPDLKALYIWKIHWKNV